MALGDEYETRWIGPQDPVPEGWTLASNEGLIRDHHSHYARLIVRKIEGEFCDDNPAANPPVR